MHGTTNASATRKVHAPSKKGKLRHIMIKPAVNGVSVETSHDHPEAGANKEHYMNPVDETTVHTKMSKFKKHMADLAAPHFSGGEDEAAEGEES